MKIFASSWRLRAQPASARANCTRCAGITSTSRKARSQSRRRVDAYSEEDVTKTAAGMRTIPLAQPLALMLKEWKLRRKQKAARTSIFPNQRGRYAEPRQHGETAVPAAVRFAWPSGTGGAGRPPRAARRASTGTRCGISRCRAGSRPGSTPRPCRPSPAIAACR